jgi:hypothetical protein
MSRSALSPSVMLATSMQAQRGVYAVLLGSGVSTGAGVPTGWGVVKELVRRVAVATNVDDADAVALAKSDPEAWWAQNVGGALGYSTLLEALAPTQSARQGILADFFEPSDGDRDEGRKVPSRAHRALAQLVKQGYVRVILTTNFDRLMEQALEAEGVFAQVVTRPEAVNGMAPLAHAGATVVKLHGDYKDLGTRNTPEELSAYPEEWRTLLGQVFDEYGLLICGWSGDWDTALVESLDATPNRRYPLYWDSRSSKGEAAQRLLQSRRGLVVEASGADELFANLSASIEALDRLAQPPLTTEMAVARLKRNLPDPLRRIDVHDLLMDTTEVVVEAIANQPLEGRVDGEAMQQLWAQHVEIAAPLAKLLSTGVWHDTDGVHDRLWMDVLQRLVDAGTSRLHTWTPGREYARLWPALIASTVMGLAAVKRDRERLIIRMSTEIEGLSASGSDIALPAAKILHPEMLLREETVNSMPRSESAYYFPASHLLRSDLRPLMHDLIPLETRYTEAFNGYEYRLSLIHDNLPDSWGPFRGEYVLRNAWSWNGDDRIPLAELAFRDAAERSRDWPWRDFLEVEDLGVHLYKHRDALERLRPLR